MILCYHDVDPDWDSPLAVTPDEFRRQCEWLSHHRQVVPLKDLVSMLDDSLLPPRGRVALTFDDGFRGVYEQALPVLVEYGLPATVFLVSETLTPGGHPVDWVDGEYPGARQTLTLSQVEELQDGGFDLQSHSSAHKVLTELDRDEARADLIRSREILEDVLGAPVGQLAYPRGRHNDDIRSAAQEAGFEWAFSLPERDEHVSRFSVPRVGIFPGNGPAILAVKTRPSYLAFRHSRLFPLARRLARR